MRVHRSFWQPSLDLEWPEGSGRTYRLVGCTLGSEFCGHQTAIACSTGDMYHFFDSDATRLGIGPMSWRTDDRSWWASLDRVMQHSNNTADSKFCDFAPANRSPLQTTLEHLRASGSDPRGVNAELAEAHDHRLVNVDWLYTS